MIYIIKYVLFQAVYSCTISKYHIKMLKHRHMTMPALGLQTTRENYSHDFSYLMCI